MAQRLFVGDLVRPTVAAAAHRLPCFDRHHYGPQFQARRPALVVHVLDEGYRESIWFLAAFRLKNGTWKQLSRHFRFDEFELVHRPKSSNLLNPFEVDRAVPFLRSAHVNLAKKFYAVIPMGDAPGFADPDVPVVLGDRPVLPEVLGRAVRDSIDALRSRRHHFVDGRWQQPILETTKAAYEVACDEVRARYKVARPHPFDDGSMVWIRQIHDCFSLVPLTRAGGGHGAQCREAWKHIGLGCTDRELGELTLAILNQPNVPIEHAAKVDPFIGRVLPYINLEAMEADLRRHWPA